MPSADLRRDIGKEVRLWSLAVVCAAAGAITVSITDSYGIGVLVFLATLGLLGPILFTYEKRRKARQAATEPGPAARTERPRHGGHRKGPPKRR